VHAQADAHAGEGTRNGYLDGIGHDGFSSFVARRCRQSNA
jgi:hypothetical protein